MAYCCIIVWSLSFSHLLHLSLQWQHRWPSDVLLCAVLVSVSSWPSHYCTSHYNGTIYRWPCDVVLCAVLVSVSSWPSHQNSSRLVHLVAGPQGAAMVGASGEQGESQNQHWTLCNSQQWPIHSTSCPASSYSEITFSPPSSCVDVFNRSGSSQGPPQSTREGGREGDYLKKTRRDSPAGNRTFPC